MRYQMLTTTHKLSGNPVTGDFTVGNGKQFVAWQPSTWPNIDSLSAPEFVEVMRKIFDTTIIGEIKNVIDDILKNNSNLEQRGHVIAIVLMCATDTLCSYGWYKENERFRYYIENCFPAAYKKFGVQLYKLYRCELIHSWNLFDVAIYPGNEKISEDNGTIQFGVLNYFSALKKSVNLLLKKMKSDPEILERCKKRYQDLRLTAKC